MPIPVPWATDTSLPSVPELPILTLPEARRFVRRASLLDQPAPTLGAALRTMGFVQVDPINVCGRMHDLILRHRVQGYREGDLHRYTHSAERPAFEHFLSGIGAGHTLSVFPSEAWPFVRASMLERRADADQRVLTEDDEGLARKILKEIAHRGPLASDEIEHEGTALTGWGTPGKSAKVMLERLFSHGRVLLTDRRGFRRVYDLPERVLPEAVLKEGRPTPKAVLRWQALVRLQQRRLVRLGPAYRKAMGKEAIPVRVEGCPTLYALASDLPLLEAVREADAEPDGKTLFLAPLDPVVYDRKVTHLLWGLDYTWEAYTPIHRRRRGHYSLPVLQGLEIIGTVDPRADRGRKRLLVAGRRVRKGAAIADGVLELAGFLGLKPRG